MTSKISFEITQSTDPSWPLLRNAQRRKQLEQIKKQAGKKLTCFIKDIEHSETSLIDKIDFCKENITKINDSITSYNMLVLYKKPIILMDKLDFCSLKNKATLPLFVDVTKISWQKF